MSYTAFETANGEAKADVEALCRHAAESGFSSSTVPTLAAVERWLTTSYYWIQGLLHRAGLSGTQTATNVVAILQELNVYDVCIKVEMALPTQIESGDPNERFQVFVDRRAELLDAIRDGTLAGLGASEYDAGQRKPVAGGLSIARKAVLTEDTDAVQPRATIGRFNNPGGVTS